MSTLNMDLRIEMADSINWILKTKTWKYTRIPQIRSKRCLVSLLDLYFSKLPQSAKDKDIFYYRPLNKYTADGPWYSEQPRGSTSYQTW